MIYDWLFLLFTDELIAAFTFLEISFCAIIMGVGAADTDYWAIGAASLVIFFGASCHAFAFDVVFEVLLTVPEGFAFALFRLLYPAPAA